MPNLPWNWEWYQTPGGSHYGQPMPTGGPEYGGGPSMELPPPTPPPNRGGGGPMPPIQVGPGSGIDGNMGGVMTPPIWDAPQKPGMDTIGGQMLPPSDPVSRPGGGLLGPPIRTEPGLGIDPKPPMGGGPVGPYTPPGGQIMPNPGKRTFPVGGGGLMPPPKAPTSSSQGQALGATMGKPGLFGKARTPKPTRGPNDGSTREGTRGQNRVGWDGEELDRRDPRRTPSPTPTPTPTRGRRP